MSDILKVCPQCNGDISSETGGCKKCSEMIVTGKNEIQINQSELSNQRDTDQTLFLIFISLVNIPITIFFAKWISILFPAIESFIFGLGILLWAITLSPTFIFFYCFLKFITEPKNSFIAAKKLLSEGIPFVLNLGRSLIILLAMTLAKLAVLLFFILLGLSLIVFAFKFIKSQLFN